MKNLITVIVPVYNSERYIGSCVESVLAQTYSLFELLLIDDGSSDNSVAVCGMFCEKDRRVRLIKQDHKGVSAARNLGIEVSKGDSLFFLDSDDLIHPWLLEALCRLQEAAHAAIAAGGSYSGESDKLQKKKIWTADLVYGPGSFYLDNRNAIKHINKEIFWGIGGKMISRRALDTIRFREDLSHGEDMLFIYQLVMSGADIAVLDRNWYYYRKHKNSATRDFSPEACRSRYRALRRICSSEMRSGRKENALYKERGILKMIAGWHDEGRRSRNKELMRYAEAAAKREKKSAIYRQLRLKEKIYFYLIMYCHPFFKLILKISGKLP